MYNSYYFIKKEKELEDMIVDHQVFFAHDVENTPHNKAREDLRTFVASKEEYETCIKFNTVQEDEQNK